MRISIVLSVTLVLFVISEILLIFKYVSLKAQYNEVQRSKKQLEQEFSIQSRDIKKQIESIYYYLDIDGRKINDFDLTYYNINDISGNIKKGEVLRFKEILDSKKCIFRFFQSSCTSCIIQQLDKLNAISKKTGIEKIILLTDYLNKDIHWYLIEKQIDLSVYETKNADIGIEFDKHEIPFIFICNEDLKIELPFVLNYNLLEYSDFFYKSLDKKLM